MKKLILRKKSINDELTNYRESLILLAGLILLVAGFKVHAATPLLKVNAVVLKPFVPTTLVIDPFVYIAKFVCGPQAIPATRIGQITNYSALQPGNYATALNVLTLRDNQPSINVYASMDGHTGNPLVVQLPISRVFETHTVTCDEILSALGVNVGTEAYEGFLYISRRQSDLDVQAVYTFASRDSFQEFRGVDYNGNVVINPEVGITSIGGAGGLGLGASIDVERIKPINRNQLNSN